MLQILRSFLNSQEGKQLTKHLIFFLIIVMGAIVTNYLCHRERAVEIFVFAPRPWQHRPARPVNVRNSAVVIEDSQTLMARVPCDPSLDSRFFSSTVSPPRTSVQSPTIAGDGA